MTLLRDARDLRVPPSLLADDTDEALPVVWQLRDRLLMRALRAYERTLCPGCGQPRHRSMNPEIDSQCYEIVQRVCNSCAALDKARADKDSGQVPGVKHYVVDAIEPGMVLPDFVIDLRPSWAKGEDESSA